MKMVAATLTKPGGRELNEDCVGCLSPEAGISCWAIADGQSEFGGGDIIAQHVVKTMLGTYQANAAISQSILLNVFEWAQRDVLNLQSSEQPNHDLRVAVAMFCTGGRSALWAHIGDVRVYAFRNGEVIARTKDHSVSQALVNAGEITSDEVRGHADRNRLLGFLGSKGKLHPTVLENRFILQPGDLFLMCTNGFWEYVTELEMLADWCKSLCLEDWLERMEVRILMTAPERHDNYSAIALMAEQES